MTVTYGERVCDSCGARFAARSSTSKRCSKECTAKGYMVWKDKRIAVVDVHPGPRVDAEGVRDGWVATTDDVLAARMFYPADMFTFEEGEAQ